MVGGPGSQKFVPDCHPTKEQLNNKMTVEFESSNNYEGLDGV